MDEQGIQTTARPTRGWLVWVVVAGGIAAYANSLNGAFLFDDTTRIVNNTNVHGLGRPDRIVYSRRPVVDLTLALNYTAGELDPRGYHLVNIAIHLLAGMVLFGLVRRTLLLDRLRADYGDAAPWLAMVIALLWTVHPLQTQCVNYITQRAESLMGLFYLLTVYCVLRGACSRHGLWWYAAAIIASVLGMASKAVMVTVPIVVLLYDWLFLSPSLRAAFRKHWPLYAGLCVTWLVLAGAGVVNGVLAIGNVSGATVGFGYDGISPLEYLATQPSVIVHYLCLSLVPYALCLDYDWPVARTVAEIVPYAMFVAGLLLLTVWLLVRRRCVAFLGVWFFVILAPTSSFIPIKDLAFEHRMYVPLAAVVTLVVLGTYRVLRAMVERRRLPSGAARVIRIVLPIAVAGVFCGLTAARNLDYRTPLAMWSDVAEKRPNSARAWYNKALALRQEGRFEESIAPLERAAELAPKMWLVHDHLGQSYAQSGRYLCQGDSLLHGRRRPQPRACPHVQQPRPGVLDGRGG